MSAPEKGTDAYAIWAAIHLGIAAEGDVLDTIGPRDLEPEQIEWLAHWLAGEGIGKLPEAAPTDPCPFTHAHTRDWCGREGCRES